MRTHRRSVPSWLGVALLLLAPRFPAAADEAPKRPEGVDYPALLEQVKEEFSESPERFSFAPAKPPAPLEDESTRALYRESWEAYYNYLTEGLTYRLEVFRWQFLSSRIIFFAVLVLVACGILFSGIQFYRAMRPPGGGAGEQTADQTTTEFEASAAGIRVSSPVLGVIILVISLAFFYLYLVYVYPIQETF